MHKNPRFNHDTQHPSYKKKKKNIRIEQVKNEVSKNLSRGTSFDASSVGRSKDIRHNVS